MNRDNGGRCVKNSFGYNDHLENEEAKNILTAETMKFTCVECEVFEIFSDEIMMMDY